MRMRVRSNARTGRNKGLTMSGHWWPITDVRDAVQLLLIGQGDIPVSAAFPPETAATIGYWRT